MADLLSTGVSGLLAVQRELDTTSHNIANASTPGYSRQVTEFSTRQADQYGSGWVGNGVDVSTIQRMYDDFLASQSRASSSSYVQLDTFATQLGRVNNLFADSSTGLSATLQDFINAVQGVSNSPTSIASRQTLLSEAESLVSRLQSYDSSLDSMEAQVNTQLESETNAISTLAQGIATLNQKISAGYAQTGQPPNDLLDQRDRLLDELATHVSVSAVKQGDNSVNVFDGSGQPLVIGQTAAKLVTTADPFDATRKVISLETSGSTIDVTGRLSGGSLGGMVDFRNQILDPARNTLGRFSVALAETMNGQHEEGIDLNGNLGGDFFATGDVLIQASTGNAGTGSLAVTRTAAGNLTTADYVMTRAAAGWSLQRKDTGAAVAMTGTGTVADPFVADGLSIVVRGTAQPGDRFQILPTRDAVDGLRVLVTDPAEVAAATPVIGSAAADNAGNATISAGEVLDATNAQLRSPVTIEFLTATTYSVNGAGSFAYAPGGDIDVNGWRVQISGSPAVGDTFEVTSNVNGSGDNRNAQRLAEVLNQPVLSGGTTSLNAAVGQFISDIGVRTNQAQVGRDAQEVVYNESVDSLQSLAGVNLDEEAAKLVEYQAAYQAMAQVISAASKMFETLLSATRN